MSSREDILARLRKHTRETYPLPDLGSLQPIVYADPVEEFKKKAKTTAGANLIELTGNEDINDIIKTAYPDARIIASNLPGIQAQLNPDTVASSQELMKTDVGIVEGRIGVAENACIWIPQQMKEKAVCFACEQLVIILDRKDIVSNMHEAYDRIARSEEFFRQYKFGTFISGPSKTADIESALVYGAQAARGVTILLK